MLRKSFGLWSTTVRVELCTRKFAISAISAISANFHGEHALRAPPNILCAHLRLQYTGKLRSTQYRYTSCTVVELPRGEKEAMLLELVFVWRTYKLCCCNVMYTSRKHHSTYQKCSYWSKVLFLLFCRSCTSLLTGSPCSNTKMLDSI